MKENTRVGKLTLLRLVDRPQPNALKPKRFWQCRCDCGNTKVLREDNIRMGLTRSCGCVVTRTHHSNMRSMFPQEERDGN